MEYQRGEEGWLVREHRGGGQVDVPCLGRPLSLEELYRGVL